MSTNQGEQEQQQDQGLQQEQQDQQLQQGRREGQDDSESIGPDDAEKLTNAGEM